MTFAEAFGLGIVATLGGLAVAALVLMMLSFAVQCAIETCRLVARMADHWDRTNYRNDLKTTLRRTVNRRETVEPFDALDALAARIREGRADR